MPRRITTRSERISRMGTSNLAVRHTAAANLVYDAAWQRVAMQRRQTDALCQTCLAEGRVAAANDVDHIIPIHVRADWRLEFDNTQLLCRMHHRRKTAADVQRY